MGSNFLADFKNEPMKPMKIKIRYEGICVSHVRLLQSVSLSSLLHLIRFIYFRHFHIPRANYFSGVTVLYSFK